MSQKLNFIIIIDQEIANKMISAGFQLVSHNGNVYTFLNQPPKNFSFDSIDKTKIAYTNILSM